MCLETFPIPTNVLILRYYSPVGRVEKGPRAGCQEIHVSALPLTDWAIWTIHLTFLGFIFFSFEKWGSRIYCPQCLLALKRPFQDPRALCLFSFLSLAFGIWCGCCFLSAWTITCNLARSSKFTSLKEPATLRLLYHTNRNIRKSSPMPKFDSCERLI